MEHADLIYLSSVVFNERARLYFSAQILLQGIPSAFESHILHVAMPVSHIGLTVSHLPTSCSFFLAALSPLDYRYIGQDNSQIGFGIDVADFFICQETPGYHPYPQLCAGLIHLFSSILTILAQ